jgi:hypothetical protein
MRIFDPKLTGSIEFLNPIRGGITGSIFGSASYSLTASYALNGGGGGGGTPGGSTTQLQYNNGGAFGGVPVATYDGTTLRLTGSFSGSLAGTASWATNLVGGAVTTVAGTTNEVLVNGGTTAVAGAVTISLPSLVDLGAGSGFNSTSITASFISASNGFTGSISASFLQGLINNTQLRNSSVSITAGAGLTTGGSVSLGGSVTLDAVAGAGISLTAPTNDAINIDTASVHFLDGVKKELNTEGVISSSAQLTSTFLEISGDNVVSSSVLSAGASQGQVTNTVNGVATTITTTQLGTTGNPQFNNITASIVSASNGFTGSISASFLQGLINNTQLRNSSVSITAGAGLTTGGSVSLGGSVTLDAVAGSGISLTAPTNDAINIDTASVHFLDGVKKELNTENVISGSVSSPSQGTISVGGFTNIDLGLQTGDSPTFTNGTFTNDLTVQGNIIAQTFIVSSSVYYVTTSFSSGSTRFGNSSDDIHQFTGSIRVQGSITGSISASNLVGAITNAQLANSTVTVGSTAISLGGTSTTITGLASLNSTSITGSNISASAGFTGSISASFLQGLINNTQLRNSSVNVGSTNIALGGTATTITGLASLNSTSITASIVSASQFTGSLFGTATTASYVRNLYISSSETANPNPSTNELWHDASTGKTYIRYRSGSNESWVLQSDPTIDVTTSLQTLQEVTDLGSTTDNVVTITNTTNATDSGSGALIVSGGAGFRGDVWGKKFYGDGSGLTGITATYTETDTLQTVTTRGNETSASLFITSTQNSTAIGIGALRVSGGLSVELDINARNITASLFGTSSFATTASFALNAANASSFPFTGSAIISGSVILIQSGSKGLEVTGSTVISGSLIVTGSVRVDRGVTGSLLGTASFALTASHLLGGSSQVTIQDEGGAGFSAGTLNFTGDAVTATNAGGGVATINITGGAGASDFPYTGSAIISGSLRIIESGSVGLTVSGSTLITGSLRVTGSVSILGDQVSNGNITASNVNVNDEAYNSTTWNGSLQVPTKNAVRDKISSLVDGSGSVGFISKFTANRTVGDSNIFDDGTKIAITGSNVIVSGSSTSFIVTGSINASAGFTGSLLGTASWALNVVGGAGGGGGNSFATYSVAGQNDVTASVSNDLLTLVAGSGMVLTTDQATQAITFASSNTNNFTRGITIADPTNAENATIMFTTSSLTINRITSVIRGTAAPSVTYTLRYAASRSLTGTEVITDGTVVASPFTGSALISSSGFTNPTVPGNNFIWLQTTAKSGTVNELFVQFQYQ